MNLSDYQDQFLTFVFVNEAALPRPGAEVYRLGIEAKAIRALSNHYPTVNALLGATIFQTLTLDYFRAVRKPTGDWADFGNEFPRWLRSHELSNQVAYLTDVARLDDSVARLERAPVDDVDLDSFSANEDDLASCTLVLNGAVQIISSDYPIVSIWEAHRNDDPRQAPSFALAKQMLARGEGEKALIFRSGWQGMVAALSESQFNWLEQLGRQRTLAQLVGEEVPPELNFSSWLQEMIAKKVIVGARKIHQPPS